MLDKFRKLVNSTMEYRRVGTDISQYTEGNIVKRQINKWIGRNIVSKLWLS
jgi:hypothetical protein